MRVFIILFATTQSPQVLCGKIGVHLQDLGTHVLRSILLDIDIGFSEIIYSFVICDVLDDLVTLLHGCFQVFLNCTNGTKSCNASRLFFFD